VYNNLTVEQCNSKTKQHFEVFKSGFICKFALMKRRSQLDKTQVLLEKNQKEC